MLSTIIYIAAPFILIAFWQLPHVFNSKPPFKRVLLLTAHPDDECMFFSPTILNLASRIQSLQVLCLSIGNDQGLGSIRKAELEKSCKVLADDVIECNALDHEALQDGMDNQWDLNVIQKIVQKQIKSQKIDVVCDSCLYPPTFLFSNYWRMRLIRLFL